MKPYFKIRNYSGKEGLNQVQLYYSHKGEQLYIDTLVRTKPIYFNGNTISGKCSEIKQDADEQNNILRTCMNKVEGIILQHKLKYGLEPTIDYIRSEYYKAGERMERDKDVITVFDEWITNKKGKKIKNIKIYKTILNDLKHLYPSNKLYFRMIDNKFLEKLLEYWLSELKIQNSTINKRLACLKHFLQSTYTSGENEYLTFKSFKSEVTDLNSSSNIVILSPVAFNKLVKHTFKRKALSYVRDLYVISSCTGLRFSDVIRLTPDNFKEKGWLITNVEKTEELQLRIPLSPLAKRILKKYKYTTRKISNQKCNEYLHLALKECKFTDMITTFSKIGPVVTPDRQEKYKVISFHSSRKYFITTCVNSGIPIGDVMAWSGHTSGTISKYITKGTNQKSKMKNLFK